MEAEYEPVTRKGHNARVIDDPASRKRSDIFMANVVNMRYEVGELCLFPSYPYGPVRTVSGVEN